MSRHPERSYRVLTADGPETWTNSQLTKVLRKVENRQKVPFAFILYMNWEEGRPRGWGPANGTLAGDTSFLLVERAPVRLHRAEAEMCLEYIREAGTFRRPRDSQAAKNLQGGPSERAQHTLQAALRALFGPRIDRPFEMFESRPGPRPRRNGVASDESNCEYRLAPQRRNYLVVPDEDTQPAHETPKPAAREHVGQATESKAKPGGGRTRSSPRHPSLTMSFSARDDHNGGIDTEVVVANRSNAANELQNHELRVGGHRLGHVEDLTWDGEEYEDFLRQRTTLRIEPRATVRASVRFRMLKDLSLRNDASVELRAVDLDGVAIRALTRLSVAPRSPVPSTLARPTSEGGGGAREVVTGAAHRRPRSLSSKKGSHSGASPYRK